MLRVLSSMRYDETLVAVMDAGIERLVEDAASACRSNDAVAFGCAVDELRRSLIAAAPDGSLGPALAFGTLAPAGDHLGKVLAGCGAPVALHCLGVLAHDETAALRSVACRVLGHVGVRYRRRSCRLRTVWLPTQAGRCANS